MTDATFNTDTRDAHFGVFQASDETPYPNNEQDQRMSSLPSNRRTGGHAQASPWRCQYTPPRHLPLSLSSPLHIDSLYRPLIWRGSSYPGASRRLEWSDSLGDASDYSPRQRACHDGSRAPLGGEVRAPGSGRFRQTPPEWQQSRMTVIRLPLGSRD